MLLESTRIDTPDLEQVLEQQIQRRTFGRVHQVRVEADEDRIIVRGCTNSYYVVQLVVLAVREVLPATPVVLDIQVGPGDRPRIGHQGCDGPLISV